MAKRAETRVGFPVIFSRLRRPIEPKFFYRFVILHVYISCDTRSVGLGQYCLPKVSNGFNYAIIDVKFASGIKNINFGFYPYTDVC